MSRGLMGAAFNMWCRPIAIYSTIEVLRQYITVTELDLLCRKHLFELTGTDPGRAPYQALSEV
jgi:hypothetical protein